MTIQKTYSRKQWVRAVNLSAFLGWAFIALPFIFQGGFWLFLWVSAIGLPIAFACCWLIGAPILKRVMRREISWGAAAWWGFVIASLISLLRIGIGRYRGWRQSLNPNFDSQIGGGAYVQEVDGILTSYGWMMLAKSTAIFLVMGIIIALLVRWLIGDPASTTNDG